MQGVLFVIKIKLQRCATTATADAEDADCGFRRSGLSSLTCTRLRKICISGRNFFFQSFCGYSQLPLQHGILLRIRYVFWTRSRFIFYEFYTWNWCFNKISVWFNSIRSSWLRLLVGYFRCKKFLDDDNWFWLVVRDGVCQVGSARPECFAIFQFAHFSLKLGENYSNLGARNNTISFTFMLHS